MNLTQLFRAATAAVLLIPFAGEAAFADGHGIMIKDAYARASSMSAKSGAAFMEIVNHSGADDRLIAVRSDAAKKVELHTHIADDNGVMKMREVENGFAIPAQGSHMLQRGGDHIMLMGLTAPLVDGEEISATLVFEGKGEIEVTIPVDLNRKPSAMHHGKMKHGEMDHSKMKH